MEVVFHRGRVLPQTWHQVSSILGSYWGLFSFSTTVIMPLPCSKIFIGFVVLLSGYCATPLNSYVES